MARAKTKPRIPAATVRVPQSDAEAEQFIARYGALMLDLEAERARHREVVAEFGRKITEQNEAFSVFEAANQVERDALHVGLCNFADANRERLTSGGKTKTVQFATGKIFWKEGATSIVWGKLNQAQVVERIEARLAELASAIASETKRALKEALRRDQAVIAGFIETTKKPSRSAMGDSPELAVTIPGVVHVQPGEGFHVEPLATQIREVA